MHSIVVVTITRALSYCQLFQQLVGDKEVESWVNGEIERLRENTSLIRYVRCSHSNQAYLHADWLIRGQCMKIIKVWFWVQQKAHSIIMDNASKSNDMQSL